MYFGVIFLAVLTFGSAVAENGIAIPLEWNDIGSYHVNLDSFYQKQLLRLMHKYHGDPLIRDTATPLTDCGDVEYYSYIAAGIPGQFMRVIMDTGSADLWLTSSKCPFWHIGCWFHTRYHSDKSSTYEEDGRPFSITYGSGSAAGYLSRDSITVGEVTVNNQTFAQVTELSYQFLFTHSDGIFGLGFPSLSVSGEDPPFVNMIKQRLVEKPFFSMYLNKNKTKGGGGEIRFGATLKKYYDGRFTFVSVTKPLFWQFILPSISVGSQDVGVNNVTAIVDSGTSLIAGPPELIQNINNAIGAKYAGGLYLVDCDKINTLPNVTFSINDETFDLRPEDYVIEMERWFFFKVCVSGFMEIDLGAPVFILGNVFMRKVYVQFNNGHGKIGFAHAV